MLQVLLTLFFFAAAALVPASAHSIKTQAMEPLISQATRLMVFSPHPDDETLGAGGLIQRVLKSGGKVKVVFMTSGEGYAEGVEMEDRIADPTAKDYRGYGALRRQEALKATAALGTRDHDVTFLGFPDDGLSYLWRSFTSRLPYLSPATMKNRPPKSEEIIPHTGYTGKCLLREMERLLAGFRPTLVATTPAQDWHPDHNATYFFVKEALRHFHKKHPSLKTVLITFLVHFEHWPVGQGSTAGAYLNPPEDFPSKGIQWISLPLTPDEVQTKRKAILRVSFSDARHGQLPDELRQIQRTLHAGQIKSE